MPADVINVFVPEKNREYSLKCTKVIYQGKKSTVCIDQNHVVNIHHDKNIKLGDTVRGKFEFQSNNHPKKDDYDFYFCKITR